MRGPRRISQRAFPKFTEPMVETAVPASLPPPVGGWNAIDPLSKMSVTEAIVLDNLYPSTAEVKLRSGKAEFATGMAGVGRKMLQYSGGTSKKLFAATDSGIYDVSASGAVGAADTTCTNGYWKHLNFAATGGNYLLAVNGVDKLKLYDGAAWVNVDGASTPAITGVTTSTLSNIIMFKSRIWFVEKNTLNAWYLGTGAVSGAATKFPVGPLFEKGGTLVAMATWSVDSGNKFDDYLLFLTSEGQLAVYEGTDPSSSTTFALVGVYYIGEPLGEEPFIKYGGDLLYLSKQGVFPISARMRSTEQVDPTKEFTYKISQAFQDRAELYSNVKGWGFCLNPVENALLINVPISTGVYSEQLVMNNITKAWCRFTGWDAADYIFYDGYVYSCLGTKTYKHWVGTSDAGTPIVARCAQAYYNFKQIYNKNMQMVRPNVTLEGTVTLQLGFDTDYQAYGGDSQFMLTSIDGGDDGALWDAGVWDTALWSSGAKPVTVGWRTVPSNVGLFHSFRLQLTTSSATFSWTSTDFVLERAGIL